MEKVIIVGFSATQKKGDESLRLAIACVLAKSISIIENKTHSADEFLGTVDSLIEIFGEDQLSEERFRKQIEETQKNFVLKFDESRRISNESVKILKDNIPWYDKYCKGKVGSKYCRRGFGKLSKPHTKKKWTRKK
jgi:hypothetical protein